MTDLETGHNHEQRMLDWHGLRPSKAARCLRVVLGRRCLISHRHGDNCLCRTVQQLNAFDHVRIWLDRQGRHVLTAEPYNADPESLRCLRHELGGLGVALEICYPSPWCPGATTLLCMTRLEKPNADRREVLANWLHACFLDDRTDVDDRIALCDTLDRMGLLPNETWMSIDTTYLTDAQCDELYACVRGVTNRNALIGEAMRNWEILHGHSFEQS